MRTLFAVFVPTLLHLLLIAVAIWGPGSGGGSFMPLATLLLSLAVVPLLTLWLWLRARSARPWPGLVLSAHLIVLVFPVTMMVLGQVLR